jgi:phosphomannomutase
MCMLPFQIVWNITYHSGTAFSRTSRCYQEHVNTPFLPPKMLANDTPGSSTSSSSIDSNRLLLRSMAETWASYDPNETTAAFVRRLLQTHENENNNDSTSTQAEFVLSSLFSPPRIDFGTAGLRAAMKPGPTGMNDLVVVQTAQGIVRYCEQQQQRPNQQNRQLCAIVGYDHRANPALKLSSLSFALLTTLVFKKAGWDCFLLHGFVATPLIPFGLIHLQKKQDSSIPVVGIMITASHNPKQDAGYKIYGPDGCQIRSPTDEGMAAAILQNLEPWMDYRHELLQLKNKNAGKDDSDNDVCLGLSRPLETEQLIDAYYMALQQSGLVTGQGCMENDWTTTTDVVSLATPRFCYTAMHGVGYRFAKRGFATFGLPPFDSVPEQQEPDAEFPTVAFPNPEEAGGLAQAQAYVAAAQKDTDGANNVIVLANDPDADRLAVAELSRSSGEWAVFTGDQIGVMLGLWLWQQLGKSKADERPIAMCASTVSSKLLAEIARVEGFHFEDTLTGFKWIGSRASQLHHEHGYKSIFSYEEAIGFCCGDVVFDKDGISAMCCFAEMSIAVYREGKTVMEHMQGIYDKYGEFVSHNGYYFVAGDSDPGAVVTKIMNHLTPPDGDWSQLVCVGPYRVESVRYLGVPGYDSTTPDHTPTLPTSASSPMLTLRFVNGLCCQFRASGTEPKFKYYMELKGAPGVPRDQVKDALMEMSQGILETLLCPAEFGLIPPSGSKLEK